MDELSERIERLQNLLIAHATGGSADDRQYQILRKEITANSLVKDIAPRFLRTCRTLDEFWQFIKYEYGRYGERRKFLWDAFRPMFERVEGSKAAPSDQSVAVALEKFDAETIHQIWLRAMDRRETDPEGAITLARTLLETVCKHILDEHDVVYASDSDLPGLYKMASKSLNIAPSQHSEAIFKQILGGCTAVVEGLGALRNRLSDAHGQGKRPVKPAPRHAELAVNLAGAVAMFLVATHQALPIKGKT
jgi:Abortive infection C-terminus